MKKNTNAPIKHGKWIEIKECLGWRCSICKVLTLHAYNMGGFGLEYKFCPNCGAKMDGVIE